jgi:hypothetical protein
MKFKYYIVDMFDGCVYGTDNEQIVKDYSYSQDAYVIYPDENRWVKAECSDDQIIDIENRL